MMDIDALSEKNVKKVMESLGLEEVNSGYYDGKWGSTSNRETVESRSPVDNSLIGSVTLGTKEDYERAVKSSIEAFDEWKEIPAPRRGAIVRKIGDALRDYKKDLGYLISIEAGKIISEGQGEVQEMIDIADFAIGLSRQLYGLTIASERPSHRLLEQWVPLGPIGVITSFNFPTAVWSWNSLIAGVAGDTVIWKPSSKVPLTAVAVTGIVDKVIREESVPNVFSLVAGRGSQIGESMLADARLPLVSFTGSVKSGRNVSEKVSRRLGRTILELGGNNAAIVSDKSDRNIALKGVTFGALATAGQRCTSTRRAIIHESIYDDFVSSLKKAYSSVKIGNPTEKGTLVGPLIDSDAVSKFSRAIQLAREEGGKVLQGGEVIEKENGFYVVPAIVECNSKMKIWMEETFAPILYVFRYSSIEEAIHLNNVVPQGLSSSMFSNDLREVQQFLSNSGSDTGIVNVNTGTAGAEIGGAFGGEKDTGGGRESGSDAWKSYMKRQTVTLNYGKDLPLAQDVEFKVD